MSLRFFQLRHKLRAVIFLITLMAAWSVAVTAVRADDELERDQVNPHWFAHNSRFWYRLDLADGVRQFVLVDAEAGTRRPAFDHARVAKLLSKLTNQPVDAEHLPVNSLDFDAKPGAVNLQGPNGSWQLDLGTYTLHAEKGSELDAVPLASLGELRNSADSNKATRLLFSNHTAEEVKIYWISRDGEQESYASLKPGEEWDTQTFVGHTWLVTDPRGKMIGVYAAVPDLGHVDLRPQASNPPNRQNPDPNAPPTATRPSEPPAETNDAPDGKHGVFIRHGDAFLYDAATGLQTRLSDDGQPGNEYDAGEVWWSPDSKFVVVMQVEAGQRHTVYTVQSSPPDQLQPKLRKIEYLKPGDRIDHARVRLFEVATGKRVPVSDELFPNPWAIDNCQWAADSSQFIFVYNQRGHQTLRVISIDPVSGKARAIVNEQSQTFIDYSGKFFYQWVNDRQFIWMSERDGWNHLYLYGIDGGVENQITHGQWVVQKVVNVDAEHRTILFKAGGIRPGEDPYYTHFCRVNFDGTNLLILTHGEGNHELTWSPDKKYYLDKWSRVDQPPITDLGRTSDGKMLCRLETADVVRQTRRFPERFVAKGRDGQTDIYGIILFPRNFDPGKKYPVVEQIYAGPQGFFTPKSFHANYGTMQRVANLGMFVVQCDGMGTSGRSKKFHDVCWKNLRDAGFPDRIPWIKAAAKKYPQMDLTRVGIFGGSAGGQSALGALIWYHDFYKVAVADCGCHDNRMDKIWWNEQWMGWPVGPEYAENSNVVNAHLMQGKLLLLLGEMDDNVDPSSTMQVVNALEKADKDFELVIVTNSGHGAAGSHYGGRRQMQFLAQNLLGPEAAAQFDR